jgi:hypothetical protein
MIYLFLYDCVRIWCEIWSFVTDLGLGIRCVERDFDILRLGSVYVNGSYWCVKLLLWARCEF